MEKYPFFTIQKSVTKKALNNHFLKLSSIHNNLYKIKVYTDTATMYKKINFIVSKSVKTNLIERSSFNFVLRNFIAYLRIKSITYV